MSKKKRISLITAVFILAIGLSLAFLAANTGKASNLLSSNKTISIKLREPGWDGYSFDETAADENGNQIEPDGEHVKNPDDYSLGYNQAKDYNPGAVITKNPQIMNTCKEKVYVAIKVSYWDDDTNPASKISYQDFVNKYLDAEHPISWQSGWTMVQSSDGDTIDQVWIYGSSEGAAVLKPNEVTNTALFDSVTLSPNLTVNDQTGCLPKFTIKVRGYAIQADNVKADEAITELYNMAMSDTDTTAAASTTNTGNH